MKNIDLSDLTEVNMGTAPPGHTYNSQGIGMPMIAGAGDYGKTNPKPKKWTTQPTRIANVGDLIVCIRATIGDLNWADKEYCLGRGVAGIHANENRVNIKYLAHYISHAKNELSKKGTGSTFLAIRKKDLESFPIPIPYPDDPEKSLAEQRRIAAILDKADAIRRKRKEAIEQAQQLIPALFYDMFGDAENMHENVLEDISNVVSGVTKGRKLVKSRIKQIPYIRVANVQDGYLDLSEIKMINATVEDLEKYRLQTGDVLLTEGGDYDKLGRGALWEGQVDNCIHQNHIFRVRLDDAYVLPEYFVSYLSTQKAKMYFLKAAKKTTNLASMNMRQLKALPVTVPPISEQQAFVVKRNNIMNHVTEQNRMVDDSNNLFNSLLQRAFKGEL